MNAREAAYVAILSSLRQEKFISHSLEHWHQCDNPSSLDYAFAQELAMGACRMAKSLDYLADAISSKRVSVKLKERAILRLALYQFYFMDKVPVYAIVDESIKLAKKYCHRTFWAFLNAILRKLESAQASLPMGHTIEALSVRHSYPEFFVSTLKNEQSSDKVEAILEAGNSPPKTTVRLRPGWNPGMAEDLVCIVPLKIPPAEVGLVADKKALGVISSSKYCYIQNITPALLVAELAARTLIAPKNILDLCASPGGKLLAAHDVFPEAALFGNDVSSNKLERLQQNLDKYGVSALLSCGNGEEFTSQGTFDVIILDVPCSNSGVLNKRPEARWRLDEETLADLEHKQHRLIEHAVTLLSSQGAIWYMTCSILKAENEKITSEVCQKYGLEEVYSQTVLPNQEGLDGGYACLLKKPL